MDQETSTQYAGKPAFTMGIFDIEMIILQFWDMILPWLKSQTKNQQKSADSWWSTEI